MGLGLHAYRAAAAAQHLRRQRHRAVSPQLQGWISLEAARDQLLCVAPLRAGMELRSVWCRQRRRTGSMGSALDSFGACQDSASIMAPASSDVYQMDDESNSRCACLGSLSAASPA